MTEMNEFDEDAWKRRTEENARIAGLIPDDIKLTVASLITGWAFSESTNADFIDAIADALLAERMAERERCAKLCETSRNLGTAMGFAAAVVIRVQPA